MARAETRSAPFPQPVACEPPNHKFMRTVQCGESARKCDPSASHGWNGVAVARVWRGSNFTVPCSSGSIRRRVVCCTEAAASGRSCRPRHASLSAANGDSVNKKHVDPRLDLGPPGSTALRAFQLHGLLAMSTLLNGVVGDHHQRHRHGARAPAPNKACHPPSTKLPLSSTSTTAPASESSVSTVCLFVSCIFVGHVDTRLVNSGLVNLAYGNFVVDELNYVVVVVFFVVVVNHVNHDICRSLGVAPFAPGGYKVFRNVKDYGAVGDGATDDTAAINRAISEGDRCGPGCVGSTKTPGLIYFPPGTYLISSPIVDFYYTQLIGNPSCLPVLKATSSFKDRWLLDGDQYGPNGKLAWGSTNVFWRQVANFVIDLTNAPSNLLVAGIHWPTAQATSLSNIVFRLSEAPDTQHQGVFIEEGSAGYVGDLVFYGGAQALSIGNQQFTMRNLTIYNAQTAIQQIWSWGWTYIGVSINNCSVGFDFSATAVGSIVIVDSHIKDTPVGVVFGQSSAPPLSNNFAFENVGLKNVPVAIQGPSGTVLAGSTGASTIAAWGRGHKYTSTSGPTSFEGAIAPNSRTPSLVAGGDYYTRSKPQYQNVPLSAIVSARDAGAKGDGSTDDTAALNALFTAAAAADKVVFLDAGIYKVSSTIKIPTGSRIFGEAYPVILSSGAFFQNANSPKPVVQIGAASGAGGSVEWSNTIVSTQGAQPGAILIEFNLASGGGTPSGLWDVHTRVGGFAGTNLQLANCPKTPSVIVTAANLNQNCVAAFMSMHVTAGATGLYMENCWLWVADHDIEKEANNQQITVYAGRGLLVESVAGPVWLYGTSVEHHQMYEYQLAGTKAVFMGQIQTETAYYQKNPDARLPFAPAAAYRDPVFLAGDSGWGLRVVDSADVLVYGAGVYSFFDNYNVSCSDIGSGAVCQKRDVSIEHSTVSVYNLNTVGATKMITVDGVDVADYSDNIDDFIASIALFRS
ncbi:pectate lyase superfamily protein-domain-containing protein [Lasiosphaeria miniovina]|uniref:Pectate lyase superfamily protein-domain-containing protein n=1 Tax=Lasiosphaeria miniovina TaxID=1954250 RepID=A0AA40A6Q3_9PEZI|nr:pectate lyase superfamily protein-domain-containing protein [Lasiosphaeria miniovina]KAK0710173.1 pectate lyase superfamily protein-domain-containing protein [Lasiosphaeria miniovina]